MNTEDEEFLSRLLDTFKEEAQDHMQAIINGVLTLEKILDSSQHSYIESVFRATHSLKGAARAVDLRDIELVCQNLESVFVAVRDQKITLQPDDFDLIHNVIATLEGLLIGNRKIKTGNLVIELKNIASRSKKEKFLKIPSEKPVNEEEQQDRELQELKLKEDLNSDVLSELNTGSATSTIRISEDRIRSLYGATDDLLSLKLTSASHIEDIRKISRLLQTWRWNLFNNMGDINSLKRNGPDVRTVEKLITFIEATKEILKTCETGLSSLTRSINQEQFGMNLVISGLIESIREIVLVPVSSLTDSLPRIIRDIARENNKEVDIVINGSDIEIDRRILEAVKDPIFHIIRNSVDHGIEPQPVRIERNKSAKGIIRIEITHARAHQITVRISDDGQGLDPDTILSAAIRKGIVTKESSKSMDNEEVMQLIFRSGLSTSEKVTSVSGRGLGLAIAQEKIKQIGGIIKIESIAGVGTTFILILPVSLATFQGVLIYAENRPFFLPLQRIERVLFLKPELISTVEGRMMYNYEEYMIPVGHLGQIIGIPEIIKEKDQRRVMVIIRHQGKYTGIIVDRVAGSQEIIVRDLGPQIRSVHLISGVTILDNNFVVPVLSIEDLADAFFGHDQTVAASSEIIRSISEKSKIMIAEDSITSRMLLKNILEGAGYDVVTAVDGLDALTKLKTDPYDLVVSDVDMPRMNGFVLTEKIRSEKKLSDIPVVLVTSLDSRDDREHGIAVGASAYIIKSTFDQTNLLDIIKRLIVKGR